MRIPLMQRFNKQISLPLIFHFGYHKGMTAYFTLIFKNIAKRFDLHYKYYYWDEYDKFLEDAHMLDGNGVLMTGHRFGDFDRLPEQYIGSHLVRDPRDLLVSGYRYHKWTKESWALKPLEKGMLFMLGLKGFNLDFDYSIMSYQQIMNAVNQELGLKIELNRCKRSFQHMLDWDYQNPKIMELRYEDVFGNEAESFEELFRHYGFHEKMIRRGLKYVRRFSFDHQKKSGQTGANKHLSRGISGQWEEYFSDELKEIFKKRHQGLLVKLGYENDDNW